MDCRDIHAVKPAEILVATGLEQGELDLFDGSPPCQAFSTAGKREKGWGKKKAYENGAKQCNETLFTEYIRLLRGLMPKVFVAENVSGLVKGVAKGCFLEILAVLKASGYRVKCQILDAQWLGVPQVRKRTIFVGVREDLKREPVFPKPLPYWYSVRDALPEIGKAIYQDDYGKPDEDITDIPARAARAARATMFIESLPPSRLKAGAYGVKQVEPGKSCPTVTIASPGNDLYIEDQRPCKSVGDDSFGSRGTVKRKFTIAELKRICAFPDDFILCGSYAQQWERLGNSVPPVMMFHVAKEIRDKVLA